MKRLLVSLTLACVTASFVAAAVEIEDVGSITFPTSGSPEAQEHFLRGVGILYSFGWKQAIEEFRAAQQLEPNFAMAYWGESLCYNHPLLAEQDRDNPMKVLLRLGATSEERLAKAPTAKEKGYVAAVEALFMGEGSPAERRIAYMEAMRRLHESFPEDQEAATFYSLSLLSAAGPMGDESLRTRVLAGAIALEVFTANPDHPGAVHYIIHAFDDPVHAPIALPAAWKFAEIAPAVSHARHMPTHIFIQHGMWNEVSQSNQSAYEVAVELWEPGDNAGGHDARARLGPVRRSPARRLRESQGVDRTHGGDCGEDRDAGAPTRGAPARQGALHRRDGAMENAAGNRRVAGSRGLCDRHERHGAGGPGAGPAGGAAAPGAGGRVPRR